MVIICMLHSFFLITRWRPCWIVQGGRGFYGWWKNFPLNSRSGHRHSRFYHFGVTWSCWRSVLQKKELAVFLCLVKVLFLRMHASSSGSSCCLVCWLTLGVWSTTACHPLHISDASVPAKGLQLCPTLCDPMDCRFFNPGNPGPPGSFVHGILQARILERVALPRFRGSSRPQGSKHLALVAGSACQCGRQKRGRFHPSVGKIPWRRGSLQLTVFCTHLW